MNDSSNPQRHFLILAAIDDSDSAEAVVLAASDYARGREGATIHLVHAFIPLSAGGSFDRSALAPADEATYARAQNRLNEFVERANQARGVTDTRGHLVTGAATDVILGVAANLQASLIVVGTHDYRGIARFLLGSVSEVVAKKAHCPVALVRPVNYPASTVPQIEPPCEDCLRVRKDTHQAKQWCERHSQHHAQAVLHYEYPASFGIGTQTFRP